MLLDISSILQRTETSEDLATRVLERTLDVIFAERGAVVLIDLKTHEVSSALARSKQYGPVEPFPVSRTILERVTRENLGILLQQVKEPAPFLPTVLFRPERYPCSRPL